MVIAMTKFFIFGIIGFYIMGIYKNADTPFTGPISIIYGFFSLAIIASPSARVPAVFLIGIIWGTTLDLFFSSIDRRFKLKINPSLFGLYNVINVLVLSPLIDKFIFYSSNMSILSFFIGCIFLFIIDIVYTFRNL